MVAAFVLVIGIFFIIQNQKDTEAAQATPTPGATPLFGPEEGLPTSIEIKPADGEIVKIVRDEQNVWSLELPLAAEANPALAEGAASQVATLAMELELEDGDLEVFGLDPPSHVITIEFESGSKHVLEIGDNTPTNSGYYVRLDQDRLMIVGLNGIDSLLNLAFFPTYLNTPTPSPLPPTETPVAPSQTPTP
jgi:hypothetical protein